MKYRLESKSGLTTLYSKPANMYIYLIIKDCYLAIYEVAAYMLGA